MEITTHRHLKPQVFTPFTFSVKIESEKEAEWFHDNVLCNLETWGKTQERNEKLFVHCRSELLGTFFSESQKAKS